MSAHNESKPKKWGRRSRIADIETSQVRAVQFGAAFVLIASIAFPLTPVHATPLTYDFGGQNSHLYNRAPVDTVREWAAPKSTPTWSPMPLMIPMYKTV
jgi:hypothetical protein